MIIKNLTRKAGTGQLLHYILRYILNEEKQLDFSHFQINDPEQKPFLIRHNVRSKSIAGYVKEFEKNELGRIHKRRDQTSVHHTILSWSHKDAAHINDKMLRAIAKKYIQVRGQNNLYIGTKHVDKKHTHLHLAMSATQLNGMSSRVSRDDFAALKVELDRYQKDHYPEIIHSSPRHGKSKLAPEKEIVIPAKSGRASEKDTLIQSLQEAFTTSKSVEDFLTAIQGLGHEPYYRANKLAGIKFEGSRKFRFSKLGYDTKKLEEISAFQSQEETELSELQDIRGRSQYRELEREDEELTRSFETEDDKKNEEVNEMHLQRFKDLTRKRS